MHLLHLAGLSSAKMTILLGKVWGSINHLSGSSMEACSDRYICVCALYKYLQVYLSTCVSVYILLAVSLEGNGTWDIIKMCLKLSVHA